MCVYWLDAACACCVCVCWSWQLLIVLMISGQQFLADEDKTVTNLPLPLSPPHVRIFLHSCSPVSSLFFLSLFTPAVILSLSSLLSWPARPLHAFLLSVFFCTVIHSSSFPSSLVFCFIASLVLRCHLLVLFFTTLPLTSAGTYFDPWLFFLHFYFLYLLLLVLHLCLRCGSLFYLLSRCLFVFPCLFPLSVLFFSHIFPHLLPLLLFSVVFFHSSSFSSHLSFFLYFSHPPSHSSNPFFTSLSFSSSLPHHTFPLLPSLIIFSFSWIYPHVVTSSHPLSVICVSFFLYHLPSPSFPSVCLLLCLFPCCVLMQNGMFYTSYVSTFPCLVKQVLPSCSVASTVCFQPSLSLFSSSSLSLSPLSFLCSLGILVMPSHRR